MKKTQKIPQALKAAIEALPGLDIPAKGRIAHHIRTGRLNQAIALCGAGQLFIWQNIWINARPFLLEQLNVLKHVESMLRSEVGKTTAG
jgi:hypothetical protein